MLDLQQVITRDLLTLFELFLVVVLARGWGLLFVIHHRICERLTGIGEELASSALDVFTPVRMLDVLGPRDILDILCMQICKVLPLFSVSGVADRDSILRIGGWRAIERVTERFCSNGTSYDTD